ncbi:MAG TPA: hypothetical protein V6D11_16630 [Waterburya sp.]
MLRCIQHLGCWATSNSTSIEVLVVRSLGERNYYTVDFLGDVTWQVAESLGYIERVATVSDRQEGEL